MYHHFLKLLLAVAIGLPISMAHAEDAKSPPSYSEALVKQAESGDVQAQANLGLVYQAGIGITPDYQQAKTWLLKAAAKNNENAQMGLWILYKEGQGVAASDTEAFKWLLATAQHGNPTFQGMVGISYANGQGVMQNDREAEKWLSLAATQKDPVAQYYLADFYLKNKRSSKYGDSLQLLTEASDKGYPPAFTDLAIMYAQGMGVSRDNAKAMQLMQKAAALGDEEAQAMLSRLRRQ